MYDHEDARDRCDVRSWLSWLWCLAEQPFCFRAVVLRRGSTLMNKVIFLLNKFEGAVSK